MRFFEITLAIILALQFLLPLFMKGQSLISLSLTLFGILAIHLGIEGDRWQMIPLYSITIVLLAQWTYHLIKRKSNPTTPLKASRLRAGIGLTLSIISILPPILLPIPSTPTGPYKVGTLSMVLVDDNRYEIYSETPNQPRKLMVQLWYPAEVSKKAKVTTWMDDIDILGPAIAKYLELPSFFLDHIKYARAHSYLQAPLSNDFSKYPVLLFSHGWNGFRAQNTYQVEELASHGYIVIAPDHTFGAVASVFPDGTVAYNNPQALPTGTDIPDEDFQNTADVLGQQWAGDLSFILDYLGNFEDNIGSGITSNRLDFDRIGAFGHSTGGGAVIQFCGQDTRCKVIMGMDPYLDPVSSQLLESGLDIPVLGLFSEAWIKRGGRNEDQFTLLQTHTSNDVFKYWIKGTTHFDFSDLPAFSPLAHTLGLKGSINGPRALRIINDYTLDFFNHYLKESEVELLNESQKVYPEVISY